MKAERRHALQTNTLATKIVELPDFWKHYGRRIVVTSVIGLLAILLAWRLYSNSVASREAVAADLANAQFVIEQFSISSPDAHLGAGASVLPGEMGRERDALDRILDESSDAAVRARALVLRGDLNLAMANYPDSPAATQPSQKRDLPLDECVRRAKASYEEALRSYADQPIPAARARFGLAALAENAAAGDKAAEGASHWDEARSQYEQIQKISNLPEPLRFLAEARLKGLDGIKQAMILGPRNEPAAPPIVQLPATHSSTTSSTSATSKLSATSTTSTATKPSAATGPAMNEATHGEKASTTSVATPQGKPTSGPAVQSPATTRAATGPATPPAMNTASHSEKASTTSVANPGTAPASKPAK